MRIKLIAQNFDIYDGDGLSQSARTGDTSLNHIFKAGASGVVLGHSESGDDPEIINKKLRTIVEKKAANLLLNELVILIGESWDEFENLSIKEVAGVIKNNCEIIFKDIPEELLEQAVLGYEPKWGSRESGRDDMPPPEPALISACVKAIKDFIKEKYNFDLYVVYGGRSTTERTLEIMKDENINGLILGSACNTVEKTLQIVEAMKKAQPEKIKILICNFKAYDLPDSYEKYCCELNKLSEDFIIYLSPTYTDIREVKELL